MTATPSNQRQPPTPGELWDYAVEGYLTTGELTEFTCHNCAAKATCPSAWDLYNTSGDCLEDK